jgi:hypothetical protein
MTAADEVNALKEAIDSLPTEKVIIVSEVYAPSFGAMSTTVTKEPHTFESDEYRDKSSVY